MSVILIVDDEAENIRSLTRYIEDRCQDWEVAGAQNHDQFRNTLAKREPDVIISDLVMATDQSGIDVLREAKAKDPLTMVILITAFEKKLDRYHAFELGAFDCVQKNMPGVIAAEEILVKTKAALRFRQLALDQIESQKRMAFLQRYFDPRVLGTIDKNREVLDMRSQTLSICFWDIRGFSLLSESLKAHPSLICEFLREYFGAAAEVIFDHNGVLDKFIGDGVMGLFGALHEKEDEGREDAANAVEAAISLKERFAEILPKWSEQWVLYTPQTVDVGLGCGIHTGDALVGNVGTGTRDQFTALGPHVNFAQRLEARAGKEQILISSSTEARVRGRFVLQNAGLINDVRHIPGSFQIFSVVSPR